MHTPKNKKQYAYAKSDGYKILSNKVKFFTSKAQKQKGIQHCLKFGLNIQ